MENEKIKNKIKNRENIAKNKSNKKVKLIKVITIIGILAIFTYLIFASFPILKQIRTQSGREEFISDVRDNPLKAYLILTFLEIAQIFVFFIPGEPIEILTGTLFGTFKGFVFIFVTTTLIYYSIFVLVKKFGKRVIYFFTSEKNKTRIDKLLNSKIFQDKRYITYILVVVYLMPGTPKDLVAIVAGFFPISYVRYLVIVTLCRIPSIITSTIIGDKALQGDIVQGGLYYLGIFLVCVIVVMIMFAYDKKKIGKKALDELK